MMHEIVGYQVMFDEHAGEPTALLEGIPSKYVIGLLSTLSNTLERKGNSRRTQWELLEAMMINFNDDVRSEITVRLLAYEKRRGAFSIFENRYMVEMIQREFIHYRTESSPQFDANPGTVELTIFKAYALIIDQTANDDNVGIHQAIEDANKDPEYRLYRMIWPYFAKQFEFTAGIDHIYEGFRGLALLNFLSRSAEYGADTIQFFKRFHKKDSSDYLGRMLSMIRDNLLAKDTGRPDEHFTQFEQDSSDPWVQSLTVNPGEIAADKEKQKDYIGMKERPMFQYGENRYVIPYWRYLYTALYPGLVFAFHRASGISDREKFPNFKKWLGLNFSEQFLFRRLINRSFSTTHVVRYYEEEAFNPDCFMRRGRNLYLVEFKDNLVTADAIQSLSFDKFKAAIDKAFIKSEHKKGDRPKGISQLARILEGLIKKCETAVISEEILPAGMKFSDLTIHPIIVYTSFYFDMPGINDYLATEFQKLFPHLTLDNIMPVTTINLQYFYERFLALGDNVLQFKNEIDSYHTYSAEQKRHATVTGEAEDQFNSAPSFQQWANEHSHSYLDHKRKDIRDELIRLWEIG